jgi:putative nucleotidyltransferase with HDIG domain
MASDSEHSISVDQLQVGVYVHLDLKWMEHPFSFNSFKIRNEAQLKTIRQLGLKSVRWDPNCSDVKPLPRKQPSDAAAEQPVTGPGGNPEISEQMMLKRKRIARMSEHRTKIARVEQAFVSAAKVIGSIDKAIYAQPEKTLREAQQLVAGIVDELLVAPELAIQVMAEKPGGESLYFHSLNVSILSMVLAREVSLPAEVVKIVGVGALFHDIGLNDVPSTILNKTTPLTQPEREFREMHCQYGHDVGRKAALPSQVLNIILQHHECLDGSGYPNKLKGDQIDLLARLVGLINAYDNLCNPVNIAQSLTPHEALSLMYAQHRSRYDGRLLQAFIRFMGVYPPGTVVGLSNDRIGLVIRVDASQPLRPTVIVYDEDIPKTEAMILDLQEEADLNIIRAIRPGQLPPAVFDYLSPRKRVSYFIDSGNPRP